MAESHLSFKAYLWIGSTIENRSSPHLLIWTKSWTLLRRRVWAVNDICTSCRIYKTKHNKNSLENPSKTNHEKNCRSSQKIRRWCWGQTKYRWIKIKRALKPSKTPLSSSISMRLTIPTTWGPRLRTYGADCQHSYSKKQLTSARRLLQKSIP